MMMKLPIIFGILFLGMNANAQNVQVQTDSIQHIEEAKGIGKTKKEIETEVKMSVSVDECLASADESRFIKRGGYAWEQLHINMSTELSTITIDGMHVFGACTDNLDPVSPY